MTRNSDAKDVYWVAGIRTPFLRSSTEFVDLTSYDLVREAIAALISRASLDPAQIDYTILGTVVSNISTSPKISVSASGPLD